MAFNWDDFSEAYALLDKKNPTEDDAEQYRTLSYTLGVVLSDELKSQLGISGIDEIKPEHFSAIKKFTEKFLYGCLSDSKYLEGMSDEDKDKMKDFFEKHWKDGIPDDFMAKALPKYSRPVQLGRLPKDSAEQIANIAKNLKALGAEDALKHFVNDTNSPNGETIATYLAHHILSAQSRLDRDAKRAAGDPKKLSDDAKAQITECLEGQVAALKNISELKTVDNYTVIDWAKPNKRGLTSRDIIDRYDEGTTRFNERLPEGETPLPEPSRQLADIVPEPEDTNVDGLTNNQPAQKIANVDPNASLDDDTRNTKSNKDRRGRDIKPKDVVDFFYEDIFLYYLNLWTDKLLNLLDNAAKAYAERQKAGTKDLENAAENMSGKTKEATLKMAAEQRAADRAIAGFARTRDERRDYMTGLNTAIVNNIISHRTGTPWPKIKDEHWEPLDTNSPADKKMVERFRQRYDANPTAFMESFYKMQEPANVKKQLKTQERAYELGYRLALTEWKHDNLLDEDLNCLNIESLANDKEFQKRVTANTKMVEAGIAGAMSIDMLNGDENMTSVSNFLNHVVEYGTRADEAIDRDIAAENFVANGKKPELSKDAYRELSEFIADTLDFAREAKVESLSLSSVLGRQSMHDVAASQIQEQENPPHSRAQILVGASLEAYNAAVLANQNDKNNLKKLKDRIFGDSSNKFAQAVQRPVHGGGRGS